MSASFDLVIIGGGPGGYAAALRAAQLGLKTACVEKRATLGGTCLNVGCIPSKALLQATAVLAFLEKQAQEMGVEVSQSQMNFEKMMQRKEAVVNSLTTGIPSLFKQQKIEWIKGDARLVSPHTVSVKGEQNVNLQAKYILLATGSDSIALPFLPFDEKMILSSTGALALNKLPKSMAVIGAGVIGLELASVFKRLGTEITLIELLDRIGGDLDSTIHQQFLNILTKQGLQFKLASQVKDASIGKNKVTLSVQGKEGESTVETEVVLVAVGRKPYTQGLGLGAVGVQVDKKGFVEVNDHFQTTVNNIYAIGDLIEGPMLAHRAYQEASAVTDILTGRQASIDYITIPNIIYTHPEVAAVGFTEADIKALGLTPFSGIAYMKANARARCANDTDGLVKVIGDKKSGKLLGMHIIAGQASEMIAEGVIALRNRMTVENLAKTCHGHPTFSETVQEACANAIGQVAH